MPSTEKKVSLTRSKARAPRFWPTIGLIDVVRAKTRLNAKGMMRS